MARFSKRLTYHYEELKRLRQSAPTLARVNQAVTEHLRAALDIDAIALMHTDPVTFLGTDAYVQGFPAGAPELFFGKIYLQNEARSFLDMKASGEGVSLLSAYTKGQLDNEPRYRELYRPAGFKHEVRTCLGVGGYLWGALCVLRGSDSRDFTETEQQFLALAAPHVGEALRTATIRAGLDMDEAGSTVTLLLDQENRLLFQSNQAEEVLSAFREGEGRGTLPPQLGSVVALLRANQARPGGAAHRLEPSLTVLDRRHRWWTVTALEPGPGSLPDVAVVLVVAPARSQERFPRLVATYNLTPRERTMVEMVAAGLSTKEIASQLYVTNYTVQDHLKHIFAKLNVTSRRELMALLFHQTFSMSRG
ncbi:MAG TPA: LuxR C-terminal-related transcriptional regulator [Symbiobacteriaceae bacterium]|nr:LuxR C-terminal-related transcriptional regulator [Symbiobacteriaceae bacterium]